MTSAHASARPAPCMYAIFGAEAFLRAEALSRITRQVLGDGADLQGRTEFDGPTSSLADVLDECRTQSLFASHRLVVVQDADDFVQAHRAELEKYAEAPSAGAVLVLVCRSWARNTRLYKIVDRLGGNIACESMKPAAVPGWAAARAKDAYGLRLRMDAARLLVDLVGTDLGILDMELTKLATFAHPRKDIGDAEIEGVVGSSRAEVVFRIADALCEGDGGGALRLWDQVVSNDRDAEYRAVGGLGYAFRRLLEFRIEVDAGSSPAQAAYKVGARMGADRLARQAMHFDRRRLEDILLELTRIDLGAKTGLAGPRMAVEKLIAARAGRDYTKSHGLSAE